MRAAYDRPGHGLGCHPEDYRRSDIAEIVLVSVVEPPVVEIVPMSMLAPPIIAVPVVATVAEVFDESVLMSEIPVLLS
jgi:hypothetical protein